MQGWLMWLVMGLLLGAMIAFLVFSFFRDKKKNKVVIYKRIQLKNITEKTSKDISLRINSIVQVNNYNVENFVPSIGVLTMKEINTVSKNLLKEIYKSNLFKKIYLADDYDPKFAASLKKLIDVKSNHWTKKCQTEIQYFLMLEEDLKTDENYNEIKSNILNKVIAKFNKEESGVADLNDIDAEINGVDDIEIEKINEFTK